VGAAAVAHWNCKKINFLLGETRFEIFNWFFVLDQYLDIWIWLI
jgi:hypothetical protein